MQNMKKTAYRTRPKDQATARPDACARMMLHDLIDKIWEAAPNDLENRAAEICSFLQLIECHPGLKKEAAALRQLQAASFRLVDLQTAAHDDFEHDMSTPNKS